MMTRLVSLKTTLLLILLSAGITSPIYAGTISIDSSLSRINAGFYMEYLEDKRDKLSIKDVQDKKYEDHWKKSQSESPSFGFTESAYWVRFTVENKTGKEIEFYLEQAYALVDKIKLYIPENSAFREIKTGDYLPFSERPLDYRTFVFPLKLKVKSKATYYMYNQMLGTLYVDLRIWSPDEFRKANLIETRMLMIFYGIIMVMIFYNLIIFLFIGRREYLYYVFFVSVLFLFQTTLEGTSFQFLWPDSPGWTNFSMPILINLLMISIGLFAFEIADINKSEKASLRKLYRASMLFLLGYLIFSLISLILPYFIALTLSAALAGVILSYICIFGIFLIFKERSRVLIIGYSAALAILLGGISFVLRTFAILPSNFLTQWSVHIGAVIMLVFFSIALSDRINTMRKELAVLNNNLEDKVKERTEELRAAMDEMEAMNDALIGLNSQIEEEFRKSQMEMKMAANIQATLFPKQAPRTEKWDIAFIYKAMSGVSGDMYDFYTDNGTLRGVSLFDVSGHGIASGLITMIARSVFSRNFSEGYNTDLNRILEKSNREMIHEIGKVDNYLTGIILRFKEDMIEYVNAGHTDLLCRRAGTGDVEIIDTGDKEIRGYFIGLEEIEGSYQTYTFNIRKDEILLLYTDCLNESKNDEGEQYGIERIKKSFQGAKGTAQDALNTILEDFYDFTETRMLQDDLTVLVLKKVK